MNFMQLCEFVLHWNWNMNLKTVMNFVITKAISGLFFFSCRYENIYIQ